MQVGMSVESSSHQKAYRRKQKTFLRKRRSTSPKAEPRSDNNKNWLFFIKISTVRANFFWFCKKIEKRLLILSKNMDI
jgi:hypothetical protein